MNYMEKENKTITVKVESLSNYDLAGRLDDILKTIQRLIKSHGDSAYMEYVVVDSEDSYYDILVTRKETDKELSLRITDEANEKRREELRDRQEFARLSKKFPQS